MKMFQSKKAVTPVVATVLLIVFALVLGVVVMSVGGDYLTLENTAPINASAMDVLNIVDSCKDKGAITEDEYEILKSKVG